MELTNYQRSVIVQLLSAKTLEAVNRIYDENRDLFLTNSGMSAVLLSTRKRVNARAITKQLMALN